MNFDFNRSLIFLRKELKFFFFKIASISSSNSNDDISAVRKFYELSEIRISVSHRRLRGFFKG